MNDTEKLNLKRDVTLLYKRFGPYITMHKWHYFMIVIGMILAAIGSGGSAYVIKPLIDNVFSAKNEAMLYLVPLAVIAIFFIKGLGSYMQGYYLSYVHTNTERLVRQKILEHVLTFELDFFNKKRGGELIARMNDISIVSDFATKYLIQFTSNCLTIIAYASVIVYNGSFLAFIAFAIMPLSLIPIRIIAKKLRSLANKNFATNVNMSSKTMEILNNIEIIKASNGERIEYEQFKQDSDKMFHLSRKSARISLLTSPFMELFGAIGIAIIVIIGGLEVLHDNMTSGEFFSLIAALFLLYKPIKAFNGSFAGVQPALVANERLSDIIDRVSTIQDGTQKLQSPIQSIEVRNVTLQYDDLIAINKLSTSFQRNSVTAIVGKSGSGKSSLMNLILRLYEPTEGNIFINNHDLKSLTQESLRENIAIVTQRIFIFHDTIANNIAYGLAMDEEKVIQALQKAQAYEFVQNMEKGIHTMLDEFGTNLSGGQRQRIAIARAIYKNPDILILDEATSALDEQTEESLKITLNELRKDKILIIIAHRPSTIELAERVLQMSEGRIINEWNQKEYQEARYKKQITDDDIV